MTRNELALAIKLDSRASLLHGQLEARSKGPISGFTPHYATAGCPVVEFLGDGRARPEPQGAEIEFLLVEDDFPLPRTRTSFAAKQGNLVQLLYGRQGQAPTGGEYRVLREAGVRIQQTFQTRQPVYLASLPILTPDRYGIMSGRHYLLGLFDNSGQALWLNPAGLEGHVLTAAYPESQRERSCEDLAQAVEHGTEWYAALRTRAIKLVEKAGEKPTEGRVHNEVVTLRAQLYVEQGLAPKDAKLRAKAEADIARGQWQLGQLEQQPGAEDVGRSLLQRIAAPATGHSRER